MTSKILDRFDKRDVDVDEQGESRKCEHVDVEETEAHHSEA